MNNHSSEQVENVFAGAIARTGADRAQWLDEMCAGDSRLRQRVDVLLRSHERAGSFLQGLATEWVDASPDDWEQLLTSLAKTPPSSLAAMNDAPSDTPRDGSNPLPTAPFHLLDGTYLFEPTRYPGSLGRLRDWEVLERIGRGGMGIVFKAIDTRLNRLVAIKILEPLGASDETAWPRFLREAQAAAAVLHDNVVVVHAAHESHGVPYLVMQYVDGDSLQERLQHGPLELSEVLRIGMQVAYGLAAAHKRGLIHRDVKPANILLERETTQVKLTDFGLACAIDDGRLTKSGKVTGTPHYMSPEQAQDLPVDARSDLFSLGCVLYAMCTGASPFEASSTMASLRAVCDQPHRPLQELQPQLPAWLSELLDRLLAKDPRDRYASAQEVGDLLRDRLSELNSGDANRFMPGQAATPGWTSRQQLARTPLLVLAGVAIAGVALFLGRMRDDAGTRSGVVEGRAESAISDSIAESTARGGNPANHPLLSSSWAWTEPENLGPIVNGPGDDSQPFLSADGLSLLFDSDRPGGYGRNDIWECRRASREAPWEAPQNLGPHVNTANEDCNPCLSTDGRRLYFASIRDPGQGSYDLWMTRREHVHASWSEPTNLGTQVNSSQIDGGPSLSADELTLWFHSYRSNIEGSDIWYSQRATTSDAFGPAQNVGQPINTPGSFGESSCAISADNRVLLWTQCTSIEPPNFELRLAGRAAAGGPFTVSLSLDPHLNAGAATSPCLAHDGLTLVYDSERAGGQGGRDLWITRRVTQVGRNETTSNASR